MCKQNNIMHEWPTSIVNIYDIAVLNQFYYYYNIICTCESCTFPFVVSNSCTEKTVYKYF